VQPVGLLMLVIRIFQTDITDYWMWSGD
jgi:hypothetical protein